MTLMLQNSKINLKRHISKAGIIFFILCACACIRNVYRYSNIEVHIPAGINIEENEIRQRLAPLNYSGSGAFTLKITVYGFSQGAEIINFSDNDRFSTRQGTAWIKALVLVMKGEDIVRADFIEASGKSREDLLDRLCSRVLETAGK